MGPNIIATEAAVVYFAAGDVYHNACLAYNNPGIS